MQRSGLNPRRRSSFGLRVGFRFRIQGLGFRLYRLGFRIQGLGFRV